MSKLADRLISTNQSAFIRGRYILESVVTAHEIIHDVHKNKEDGLILKLDYEKAYDKVSIEFLEEMLKQRGFSQKWLDKIRCLLLKGSVGIQINDQNSNFFETGKGLRHGDPFAPILFNMIADVFSTMLIKLLMQVLFLGCSLCSEREGSSACSMQTIPCYSWKMIWKRL
jgi:hypothetical protein